jgi:uncharacterized membrane protein
MIRLVAVFTFALLSAVCSAREGTLPPAPGLVAPDRGDLWAHMTPEQRREMWQQLTPEERLAAWRRLTPAQRQAIRDRLPPGERQALRDGRLGHPGVEEGRPAQPPGTRLSPDERRSLREAIREVHRETRHHR